MYKSKKKNSKRNHKANYVGYNAYHCQTLNIKKDMKVKQSPIKSLLSKIKKSVARKV